MITIESYLNCVTCDKSGCTHQQELAHCLCMDWSSFLFIRMLESQITVFDSTEILQKSKKSRNVYFSERNSIRFEPDSRPLCDHARMSGT